MRYELGMEVGGRFYALGQRQADQRFLLQSPFALWENVYRPTFRSMTRAAAYREEHGRLDVTTSWDTRCRVSDLRIRKRVGG